MSTTSAVDAVDVRLALEGDGEAYGRLYDRYAPKVRTVVAAVSGDFGAVEDMTQEVFLRGYRRMATLDNPSSFSSWIHGIARLVARERRRQLRRNRHEFVTINGDEHVNVEVSSAEASEEQRRVMAAVSELPERERLVLHAYFFHEQSANKAAADLEMSRSGFYAALERALGRLRVRLSSSPVTRTSSRGKP